MVKPKWYLHKGEKIEGNEVTYSDKKAGVTYHLDTVKNSLDINASAKALQNQHRILGKVSSNVGQKTGNIAKTVVHLRQVMDGQGVRDNINVNLNVKGASYESLPISPSELLQQDIRSLDYKKERVSDVKDLAKDKLKTAGKYAAVGAVVGVVGGVLTFGLLPAIVAPAIIGFNIAQYAAITAGAGAALGAEASILQEGVGIGTSPGWKTRIKVNPDSYAHVVKAKGKY